MTDEAADVWVYLQHDKTDLAKDSLELLAAGRKVADRLGQRVVGVILGHDTGPLASEAVRFGADSVLVVDSPAFEVYFNLRYIDAIHSLVI